AAVFERLLKRLRANWWTERDSNSWKATDRLETCVFRAPAPGPQSDSAAPSGAFVLWATLCRDCSGERPQRSAGILALRARGDGDGHSRTEGPASPTLSAWGSYPNEAAFWGAYRETARSSNRAHSRRRARRLDCSWCCTPVRPGVRSSTPPM